MDMRHNEYRAIRKRHNAREMRRLRRKMRGAERRLDVQLDPAEALRAANTLGLARKIFGDGARGWRRSADGRASLCSTSTTWPRYAALAADPGPASRYSSGSASML